MNKLILYVLPVFLFISCTRTYDRPGGPVDESYWLQKERGLVVYSDYRCDVFVVETRFGYSVISAGAGIPPLRGAVVYGDFSRYGGQSMYNRSEGYIQNIHVMDYWLSYWQALDLADYECQVY